MMSERHALVLAGLPCTGKSLFASVAGERGVGVLRTAGSTSGGDLDWTAILSSESDTASDRVVLDSVRAPDQFEACLERFATVYFVVLHAAITQRERRFVARQDRRPEAEGFSARDRREIEMGMPQLYVLADRVLDSSNTDIPLFRSTIDLFISDWLVGGAGGHRQWSRPDRKLCFPEYE